MKTKRFLFLLIIFVASLILATGCSGKATSVTTPEPSGSNDNKNTIINDVKEDEETDNNYSKNTDGHWKKSDKSDLEAHSFIIDSVEAANCQQSGVITYKCTKCGYQKDEDIPQLKHEYSTIHVHEEEGADNCTHLVKNVAECKMCKQTITLSEKTVSAHKYVSSITTKATCISNGVKTYKCKNCNDTYTENYTNVNAHSWVFESNNGNKTTYKCSYCNSTKTAINAKTEVSSTISSGELYSTPIIEMKNATLELDTRTKNQLNNYENVNISVEVVDSNSLNLDDDVKGYLVDNNVYDFNLTADSNAISNFNGNITITIPYELSADEDPESIAIGYLNNGELTKINATYENGYITFETNHFSYYTVIKMAKKDICQLFGHNSILIDRIASTCASEGSRIYKCRRCGEITTESIDKIEHEWIGKETIPATYEAEGTTIYECVNCHETKIHKFPKLVQTEYDSTLLKVYDSTLNQMRNGGYNLSYSYVYKDGSYNREDKMTSFIDGDTLVSYDDRRLYTFDLVSGDQATYYHSGNYYSKYVGNYYLQNNGLLTLQSLVEDSAYSIPSIVNKYIDMDKVSPYIEKFVKAFCDEREVDGNYELVFNRDKVLDMIDNVKSKTVSELLDIYFGEGSANKLKNKLRMYEKMKCSAVIDDFSEEYGIDLMGLYEYALDYLNYYNDIVGNKVDIDDIKEYYESNKDLTVEEVLDKYSCFIDMDDILEWLDENAYELMQDFGFKDRYLDSFTDMINSMEAKLVFSKDFKPISGIITYTLDNRYDYCLTLELNDDNQSYKEFIKEVNDNIKPLTITEPNYEWYINLLNQKFGLDLNYEKGYDSNGQFVLISSYMSIDDFKRIYRYSDYYYYDSSYNKLMRDVEEYEYVFLEFRLGNYDSSVRHYVDYYFDSIYMNPNIMLYGVYEDDDVDQIRLLSAYSFDITNIIYRIDNDTYFMTSKSLPSEHMLKYEIVNERDIPADAIIYESSLTNEGNAYIFVKVYCINCDEIYYYKYFVDMKDGLISFDYYGHDTEYCINSGSVESYWYTFTDDNLRISISYVLNSDGSITNRINNVYLNDYSLRRYNNYQSSNYSGKYESYVSSDKKVSFTFIESKTDGCNITDYYKLIINDKEWILEDSYFDHKYVATRSTEAGEDCCHTVEITTYTCEKCGLHYTNRNTYSSHKNTEYITLLEPTTTQRGYKIQICYDCNKVVSSSYIYPQVDKQLVMEDCSYLDDTNSSYLIGYFDKYNYDYIGEYDVKLMAGYYDNNELKISNDVSIDYISYSTYKKLEYNENGFTYNRDLYCDYLKFKKDEVEKAFESLDDKYFPVVVATSRYGNSVFTLVIE